MAGGHVVDDIDKKLLAALLDDGRISVNKLAEVVGISRANAYTRLDRLRDEGVIDGFSTRLDPRRLGLDVAALVLVNIEQKSWRELHEQFLSLPGVEHLLVTSGNFDFALLVRVPDVETLRDVVLEELQSIEGVRSTQTIFVLDDTRFDRHAIEALAAGDGNDER